MTILEAGCGRHWVLDMGDLEYTLTGIDLDPAALHLRKAIYHDLDEGIVGDLCTVEVPEASYDVVISNFVLEHVQNADVALRNFVKWMRPGGLLILNVPERETARAFFTRILPHRAHVWYYRYILKNKNAGKPGFNPYRTYHHPIIGCTQLSQFLADQGVSCESRVGDAFRRDGLGMKKIAVQALLQLTAVLSFGRLTADYSDVLYIAFKKEDGRQSQPPYTQMKQQHISNFS